MDGQSASQIQSQESRVLLLFLLLWQAMFKVADRAILILLKFIKGFLKYIGELCQLETLIEFAKSLPETMYSIHKSLGLKNDNFVKYVVCPKCKNVYNMDDCVIRKLNGNVVSAKCSYVGFPRHPHPHRRRPCGTILMKSMRSHTGKKFLHPKEIYCYRKLTESLQDLILRPDFAEKCESWRDRQTKLPEGVLGDCYEGKIWRDFQVVEDEPFLSVPNNFGLMMNIDWFQPTKHGCHSIGVIYLVVMNLPRDERFKAENVIIVGIIPGPKEPKNHVNPFLQPLVDELIDLWDGVLLNDRDGGVEKYRAALLALSSDIPATRKCGGFVGHNARKG